MVLFIMQFSPVSCSCLALMPKYLPSKVFWNTLSLCSSLNVRDQVPHPNSTTGSIRDVPTLIFTFSGVTQEVKRCRTEMVAGIS